MEVRETRVKGKLRKVQVSTCPAELLVAAIICCRRAGLTDVLEQFTKVNTLTTPELDELAVAIGRSQGHEWALSAMLGYPEDN